ncbi:MAG: hypothetical protein H8K10_02245 [Nitrospira sp.]|nr:hypothetical protein [Nitrospira sp.]
MGQPDCAGRTRGARLVLGLSILVLCVGLLPGCQTVGSFNVNTVLDLHDAQVGDDVRKDLAACTGRENDGYWYVRETYEA